MMNNSRTFLCFLIVLVAAGHCSPVPPPGCVGDLTPSTEISGLNQKGDDPSTPRFRLHLTRHTLNKGRRDSRQAYKVHVSVMTSKVAFSDAKIALEAHGDCGVGTMTYDSKDFFQVLQSNDSCPQLFATSHKTPMTQLPPLIWTPPECGCVLFRALIIEKGTVYYAEEKGVQKGPLAQLVCVNRGTRKDHLDALCHVVDRYLTKEIISSDFFLARHGLKERLVDNYQLDLAVKLRRSDTRVCCEKPSEDSRLECFDDIRWRRVDRFCEDGVPDLPFTEHRMAHMRRKERECCFIFGVHRYSCFARDSRGGQSILGASALDFSLDETDPANDVAEFSSEKDKDLLTLLSPISFDVGKNEEKKEEENQAMQIDARGNEDEEADDDDDQIKNPKPMARQKKHHKHRKHHKNTKTDDEAHLSKGPQGLPTSTTPSEDSYMPAKHGSVPSSQHTDRVRGIPTELSHTKSDVSRRQMLRGETYPDADLSRERTSRKKNNGQGRRGGLRKSGERKNGRRRSSTEKPGARQRSQELPGGMVDEDWATGHLAPTRGQYPEEQEGGVSWMSRFSSFPMGKVAGVSRGVQTGLSRRFSSAERRKNAGVQGGFVDRSSRQSAAGSVQGSLSRRLTSTERRKKGGVRDGIQPQGRLSVDKTLNKLERRIMRLKVKQHCCEAGAAAASKVFGQFERTWGECRHSGEKLVSHLDLAFGSRLCLDQFKKCCVEMAISGPAMTSQEFREAEHRFLNNGRHSAEVTGLDRGDSHINQEFDVDARGTPEANDINSERRPKNMRAIPEDDFLDEDSGGPALFDRMDNEMASEYDALDRGERDKVEGHHQPKVRVDKGKDDGDESDDEDNDESDDNNDNDDDNDDNDDDGDDDEDEDDEFEREIGIVGTEVVDGKEIPKKRASSEKIEKVTDVRKEMPEKDAKTKSQAPVKRQEERKEMSRESDVEANDLDEVGGEAGNRDVATTDFDAQALDLISRPTLQRLRSRTHSSSKQHRRGKHGSSSKRGRSRSRSREGRRRSSSRRSGKTNKERRHRKGRHHNRHSSSTLPFGRAGAKDSHEMAAMNSRRVDGAMDSKELAEAYGHGMLAMRDRATSRSRRHYRFLN